MTMPAPSWQIPPEPAGPAPGVAFASHGARLGAYVLDAILLGTIVSVITIAALLPMVGTIIARWQDDRAYWSDATRWAELGGGFSLFMIGLLVVTVIGLLYFPFFWARGGATPGMRAAGIRVVNDRDGSRIGWGAAILRLIGFWISGAVLLPRLRVDPRRFAPAGLARPHRGHLRHRGALIRARAPGSAAYPPTATVTVAVMFQRSPSGTLAGSTTAR